MKSSQELSTVFLRKLQFYNYLVETSQKATLNFYFKQRFLVKPSNFPIYFTHDCGCLQQSMLLNFPQWCQSCSCFFRQHITHSFKYCYILICHLHSHLYYKKIASFLLNIWHHAIFQHNFTFFHKHILSFMIKSQETSLIFIVSNLTSSFPTSSMFFYISSSSRYENYFLFKMLFF